MTVTPPAPVLPPLPSWSDPAAVTSYFVTIITLVVGVVAAFKPGFSEPAVVQAVVGSVGIVVAGIAQIVNVFTHRLATAKVHVAMIAAGLR